MEKDSLVPNCVCCLQLLQLCISECGTNCPVPSPVAEMATCVRSGDCEAGLCCVRYLKGKRCQRIPKEGETCLLRGGRSKLRRNLDRCDCALGLTCRAQAESLKNQGVCLPKPRENTRSARHSGKRRNAERRCG